MRRIRSFFYLLFAVTLLMYGLPRFKLVGIESVSDGFAIIWSAFAVIIIGAHLFDCLNVAKEKEYRAHNTYKAHERVRQFRSS